MLHLMFPPAAQTAEAPAESLGHLLQRAREARDAGRTDEAVRAYGAMLAQVPTHETALFERAEALAWGGRYAEAEGGYRAFRAAYPGRAEEADLRLAQLEAWRDRTGSAVDLLDPWVKQGQRQATLDAATYLAWGGRIPESLSRLRAWLREHPEDQAARLLEAKVLGWDGQYSAARTSYGEVLKETPTHREALAGLARLDVWEGRPDQALGALDRMDPEGRDHVDSQLLRAQAERGQGSLRAARVRAEGLASRPGPLQRDAREFLEDLVTLQGPWVELSSARTDTNEGLRLEDPMLRARLPFFDGHLGLLGAQHRREYLGSARSTNEVGLGLSHPLGARWQASAFLSQCSDVGGAPASGHLFGLGWNPIPGLDLELSQGRTLATFTPAALEQRTAFDTLDLGATWRPGAGRHAFSAGLGRADLSAGSVRRSFLGSYEFRIPVTGVDLRAGALVRRFGYSETLPLGFFNPEQYRWTGAFGSLAWHKGRVLEAGLQVRTGRQIVNGGPSQSTWAYGVNLAWSPRPWPIQLFMTWNDSEAGLPIIDPTDPSAYREHTLRFGLKIHGNHWLW